jgi:hypothetical protein
VHTERLDPDPMGAIVCEEILAPVLVVASGARHNFNREIFDAE